MCAHMRTSTVLLYNHNNTYYYIQWLLDLLQGHLLQGRLARGTPTAGGHGHAAGDLDVVERLRQRWVLLWALGLWKKGRGGGRVKYSQCGE